QPTVNYTLSLHDALPISGQFEAYDVVTYEQGKQLEVAAHRQQLHKGSVAVDGTTIVDYSADEQSPECCPTTARRTAIAFNGGELDRKSTRLNSSHEWISY